MRQSWTDDRLDDFRGEVNRRFDEVYRRFDAVDRRFDEVDKRFGKVETELHRINDRLDGMHKVMIQAVLMMSGSILASFLVLASLILTRT